MAQGTKKNSGTGLGYEAKLWQMADVQGNRLEAAEYEHVVLGLVFLKKIADASED